MAGFSGSRFLGGNPPVDASERVYPTFPTAPMLAPPQPPHDTARSQSPTAYPQQWRVVRRDVIGNQTTLAIVPTMQAAELLVHQYTNRGLPKGTVIFAIPFV